MRIRIQLRKIEEDHFHVLMIQNKKGKDAVIVSTHVQAKQVSRTIDKYLGGIQWSEIQDSSEEGS